MPITVVLAKIANVIGKMFPIHILGVTLLGTYFLFKYSFLLYWLGDTKMCRVDTENQKKQFYYTLQEIRGCDRGIAECVDVLSKDAEEKKEDPRVYLQEPANDVCKALKPAKVISLLLFLGLYYLYVAYKVVSLKGFFGFPFLVAFVNVFFVWTTFGIYVSRSKKIQQGCAEDMMEPYGVTIQDQNKKANREFKGVATTTFFLLFLTLLVSYYAYIFSDNK